MESSLHMSTSIYRNSPEGAFLTTAGSQASDLNERTRARIFFWRVAPTSRGGWHHASPPRGGISSLCQLIEVIEFDGESRRAGTGEKKDEGLRAGLRGGVPSTLVKPSPWSNLLYPHRHRIAPDPEGCGLRVPMGRIGGRAWARGRRRGGRR